MGKYKLNPDDSVLVIIDLQEKLMNVMKDKDKVYKNTNLLLSTAREFGIPVVLSEQYPRGLGPTVCLLYTSKEEVMKRIEVEDIRISSADRNIEGLIKQKSKSLDEQARLWALLNALPVEPEEPTQEQEAGV